MRILIIDDDETTLLLTRRRLERAGFVVAVRTEPIGTTNQVRSFLPDVLLIDVSMPAMSGDRLAQLVRRSDSSPRVVLFSDRPVSQLESLARSCEADGWAHKADHEGLIALLRSLPPAA